MDESVVLSKSGAAIALLLGFALPVIGAVVVFLQGHGAGLQAGFQGVEGIGDDVRALHTALLFTAPALVLQLVGFGILTMLLREAGDRGVAFLSFSLLVFALILFSIQLTFHGTVTVWAGEAWARFGAVPEFFEVLRQWMNTGVQHLFVVVGLVAVVGFGWSVIDTVLLARWVGWLLVLWGAGWIGLAIVSRDTLPAALFFPPLFLGISLLL
jgi:hypothetical protein